MIKARHNPFWFWFFRNFFALRQAIHFRKMTVVSEVSIPENQSVLLLQNHFSWWDGNWSYWLSRTIFRRKFHVMMDEENLKQRMFLNQIGVFSVQKNHRELIASLDYSTEILMNPGNLLTIYPTGVMLTQHQQNMAFQKGISRILAGESGHVAVVFAVFLVDYFGFAQPEIRIYLESYTGERTTEALQQAYKSFYQGCIEKQTE